MNVRCPRCGKSFVLAGESGLCPACGTSVSAIDDQAVKDFSKDESKVLGDPGVMLPRRIRRKEAPVEMPEADEPEENARVVWIVTSAALLIIAGLVLTAVLVNRQKKVVTTTPPRPTPARAPTPSSQPTRAPPAPAKTPAATPVLAPPTQVVEAAPAPQTTTTEALAPAPPAEPVRVPRFALDPAPAPRQRASSPTPRSTTPSNAA